MSTAIIVSGTLRELVNASSSWTIPGDYFLVTDKNIYNTNDSTVVGNSLDIIAETVKSSHVNFKSILISVDSTLPDNLKHHSSINMINKWRLAYFSVLPLLVNGNYDRVILLRPDLYLIKKQPFKIFLELKLEENTIYTTTGIVQKEFKPYGFRDIMNDVLLMFTFKTYDRFSNELLSYYIENYNDTQVNGYEVHSMMAKFCKEKGFTVKGDISNYFDFCVLRYTSRSMFEHGSLKSEFSVNDLRLSEQQWWKEVYGK